MSKRLENRVLKPAVKGVYILFCASAFVVMILMGFRGIWDIAGHVVNGWLFHFGGNQQAPDERLAVVNILQGFEFLLLAPMIFVIVISVGNYLKDVLSSGDNPQMAERQLHRIKALMISLMVSVVGTELVKRLVERQVDMQSLIFGGTLLVLLTGYAAFLFIVPQVLENKTEDNVSVTQVPPTRRADL